LNATALETTAPTTRLDACKDLLRGAVLGAIAFVIFVLAVGTVSFYSDRSLIDQKIRAAIQDETIQIPGRWDIADPRGIDTFSDCAILQSLKLSPDRFLPNLFDTYFYTALYNAGKVHPCNSLSRSYENDGATVLAVTSYSRYWFGSASLAKIALGQTGLSLGQYRDVVFFSLILSLGFFTLTFYQSFRPASLFFTPYLISVCFGFSLLSLGQSISQTPEEIIALLILSIYNLTHIENRSLYVRAACYSLLGAICVYFDLLNAVVMLVPTIMSCQWIASTLSKTLPYSSSSKNCRILSLLINLGLVVTGACFAIFIRLVGYSYVSGKNFLDVLLQWKNALTFRIAGNVTVFSDQRTGTITDVARALWQTRADPFYGILTNHAFCSFSWSSWPTCIGADFFYALGFLGWVLLVPLCWGLAKKQKLPLDVVLGFLLGGIMIPGWFFIFKQHTIIHAWMTGRLLSLFAGLGMSAAITMLVILITRRSVEEPPDLARRR
jgi:hypothetical protein